MGKKIKTYADLITRKNTEIPINLSSKAIKKLMEDEPNLTVGQFRKRIGDI